jgi:ABC-2 type transport system ATP-binding protein
MDNVIAIRGVSKTYRTGLAALKHIDLDILRGEIFALLGPNGAGKTTLINIVCGIVTKSSGTVTVDGHDIQTDFRAARALIGLVPQELSLSPFETPLAAVNFSRGLFGKKRDPAVVERVLTSLALWEKKDQRIAALSGGMKRRVLIAKALVHEPRILFLDEPTAGVDVELRKEMWQAVRDLRDTGVTVILTTHYIEEAEEMADRVGVIAKGEMVVVDEKLSLMGRMGQKRLTLHLQKPLAKIPKALASHALTLAAGGDELIYTYDTRAARTGITKLLQGLAAAGIAFNDLRTEQSSLEEIFVDLVKR